MENIEKTILKRYINKGIIVFALFIAVFILAYILKLPQQFDSNLHYSNYVFKSHMFLILYRLVVYFSFPLIISLFEKNNSKFSKRLLENFNIQFCTYSIIAGLYTLIGLDEILNVGIFDSSGAFLFVTAFVFSLILNKKFPSLFE